MRQRTVTNNEPPPPARCQDVTAAKVRTPIDRARCATVAHGWFCAADATTPKPDEGVTLGELRGKAARRRVDPFAMLTTQHQRPGLRPASREVASSPSPRPSTASCADKGGRVERDLRELDGGRGPSRTRTRRSFGTTHPQPRNVNCSGQGKMRRPSTRDADMTQT